MVVETGEGPLSHISHPSLPAVAVLCPYPSLGVLGLAHAHFTDAEVLLPPGSSPSGGSSARWGWGFLLPLVGLCPSWLHRAVFPLNLWSCRCVMEKGSWRSALCSQAGVSPPRNISLGCFMCPLAPNQEAFSRVFLFNFSIIL